MTRHMTRYVARLNPPRAWQSEEYDMAERPTLAVIEDCDEPVDTGLLDANGTPLWRVRERERCGFVGRGDG